MELPIQKVVVAEVARPEAVPAPEPTDDGLTAHQRLLLSSKPRHLPESGVDSRQRGSNFFPAFQKGILAKFPFGTFGGAFPQSFFWLEMGVAE